MEWYPEFWDLQPFKETAVQYLERELEGLPGITLADFKDTKFDILLCSIPQHVPMWIKLRDLYQPQSKLIFQVGNAWTFDNNFPIKNILASAKIHQLVGFHVQEYHQEFSLDLFNFEPIKGTKKIYSFINCLNTVSLYREDWELFLELERLLPEYEFCSFGGQCRDSAIAPISEVARLTKEAEFIYHVKSMGDGFSHGMFTAAACGKPIITRLSDYKGKLAEPLIEDGISSVIVDNKTPEQIAEIIRLIGSRPSTDLDLMSKMSYANFKDNVDFDKEQQSIEVFLQNLL